ncbi:putative membrane protein [Shigella flexneri 1235-66]|nr:putative membrane protein [Shigella flexneri 1235-66]
MIEESFVNTHTALSRWVILFWHWALGSALPQSIMPSLFYL